MSSILDSSGETPISPLLRIYTKTKGAHWVAVTNLVYLEAVANYTWLRWVNGDQLLSPHTLKIFIGQLPPTDFVRIHRRYLVNRQFIAQLELSLEGAVVYLKSGISLPVSRRKLVELRRQIADVPVLKKY